MELWLGEGFPLFLSCCNIFVVSELMAGNCLTIGIEFLMGSSTTVDPGGDGANFGVLLSSASNGMLSSLILVGLFDRDLLLDRVLLGASAALAACLGVA